MAKLIRVGIIGANASGGWAGEGHVPAVRSLDGLDLAAVATNSQKTADASARASAFQRPMVTVWTSSERQTLIS
jgi:predicted dehydrogenase